jgi:hypothetical protein
MASPAALWANIFFYEVRTMKNEILKICEQLRGYSVTEPYFEVIEIKNNGNKTFTLTCKVVDPAEEKGANDESN